MAPVTSATACEACMNLGFARFLRHLAGEPEAAHMNEKRCLSRGLYFNLC